uniref:Uncharacterized protein n=1 Tax=Thermodesulfobacterium geofontis TaxID=1295609 RepID=A0A7V4N3P2_9BACT
MLTRANSVVAQKIIDHFLSLPLKSYSLHLLGVILHVYADTWSHQNFMGLEHDMNDVKNLKVEGETKQSIKDLLERLKEKIAEYAFPKLGHAQAGTIPDEPYRIWEYEDYKGRYFKISNLERSLDAAQNCYMVLLKFLKSFPQFSTRLSIPWQNIVNKIGELFSIKGDLEDRKTVWKEAISNGEFDFELENKDIGLSYNDREWFKAAVEVIKKEGEPDKYIRKEGFEKSNWKYFHDAAAYYRFFVLHEILPEYGIICG